MKKVSILLAVLVLLSGCSVQTFETVDDPNDVVVMATPAQLTFDLPDHAASAVMQGASGSLYFCDGYEIAVEVLSSGNLDSTLQNLTGFHKEDLKLMHRKRSNADCYEGVWTAVGEEGDCIGRFLILDDGKFHYCISLMTLSENAGSCAEEWNAVMSSVTLSVS